MRVSAAGREIFRWMTKTENRKCAQWAHFLFVPSTFPFCLSDHVYHLVLLNETHHWHKDIQEKVKVIYGAYVYSDEHRTHCCELTPSYELTCVGVVWDPRDLTDEAVEELESVLIEHCDAGGCRYVHCWALKTFVGAVPEQQQDLPWLTFGDESYGEYVDALLELWSSGSLAWTGPIPAPRKPLEGSESPEQGPRSPEAV